MNQLQSLGVTCDAPLIEMGGLSCTIQHPEELLTEVPSTSKLARHFFCRMVYNPKWRSSVFPTPNGPCPAFRWRSEL